MYRLYCLSPALQLNSPHLLNAQRTHRLLQELIVYMSLHITVLEEMCGPELDARQSHHPQSN